MVAAAYQRLRVNIKKTLFFLISFLTACTGEPPQNIGEQDGRLTACPRSPNCVSSFESDAEHGIQPLKANLREVEQILLGLEEANIVEYKDGYLCAEFTSRLMRFVDDVEFLEYSEAGVVHVRSASRLGYSDLGTNRKRIENIRRLLLRI